MEHALQTAITAHRNALIHDLSEPFQTLAQQCAPKLTDNNDSGALDSMLYNVCMAIDNNLITNSRLYVASITGKQLSANVSGKGIDISQRGQNLTHRPYMLNLDQQQNFSLSEVYIDQPSHRPCLTAIQQITDVKQSICAYLFADFFLSDLPDNAPPIKNVQTWRQIKGDPAIRGQVFTQQRIISKMDEQLEQVHDIITELIIEHGIFHAKLHYSSSRTTLWLYDDPYAYRVHVLNEIISPEVCLAYPRKNYPQKAIVPPEQIAPLFRRFASLRYADETIYLRSASLNIINGLVGLTFSCDGSHYMQFEDFLGKTDIFWFG